MLREEGNVELTDLNKSSAMPSYKTGMMKKDFFDTGKYRKRTDLTEKLVLDSGENYTSGEPRPPSIKRQAAPVINLS